jgi:hypothetical protein
LAADDLTKTCGEFVGRTRFRKDRRNLALRRFALRWLAETADRYDWNVPRANVPLQDMKKRPALMLHREIRDDDVGMKLPSPRIRLGSVLRGDDVKSTGEEREGVHRARVLVPFDEQHERAVARMTAIHGSSVPEEFREFDDIASGRKGLSGP